MVQFGAVLPRIRQTVLDRLDGQGLRRDRVLAAAIRLIDLGSSGLAGRSTRR